MKKLIYTLLATASLGAAVLPANGEVRGGKPDWINFGFYENANDELASAAVDSARVVFLGNSITQFWVERRPGFFAAHPGYVGRGIAGQTTYQFLGRFREDVINLRPAVVVINAATNDVAENTHVYDEERTFGNIVSMVELAQANGIRVILTTTLPAIGFGWDPTITDAPAKIAALNKRLRAYASDKNIPFVDYYSAMAADDGSGALKPGYSNDGVHPTVEGYEVMEALIVPVINSVL